MRRDLMANITMNQEKMIVKKIILDLLFAYFNKDEDNPHNFEIDALISALNYLNIKEINEDLGFIKNIQNIIDTNT